MTLFLLQHTRIDPALLPEYGQSRSVILEDIASIG